MSVDRAKRLRLAPVARFVCASALAAIGWNSLRASASMLFAAAR